MRLPKAVGVASGILTLLSLLLLPPQFLPVPTWRISCSAPWTALTCEDTPHASAALLILPTYLLPCTRQQHSAITKQADHLLPFHWWDTLMQYDLSHTPGSFHWKQRKETREKEEIKLHKQTRKIALQEKHNKFHHSRVWTLLCPCQELTWVKLRGLLTRWVNPCLLFFSTEALQRIKLAVVLHLQLSLEHHNANF